MAKTNNLAYDISVYEQLPKKQPEPKIRVHKNTVEKTVSAVKIFIMGAATLFLLCAVLYGKSEINSLYAQATDAQSQLSLLTNESARLETELERKTSISSVENYAENDLGLVKLDKSQVKYVKIQSENVVEVVKNDDGNILITIKNWFSDVLEYIGF